MYFQEDVRGHFSSPDHLTIVLKLKIWIKLKILVTLWLLSALIVQAGVVFCW